MLSQERHFVAKLEQFLGAVVNDINATKACKYQLTKKCFSSVCSYIRITMKLGRILHTYRANSIFNLISATTRRKSVITEVLDKYL